MTILTVQTGAVVQSANGRIPAIIGEEDDEAWLDDTMEVGPLLDLIRRPRDDLIVRM